MKHSLIIGLTALVLSAAQPSAKTVDNVCALTPTEIFDRVGPHIVQIISFGVDPYRVAGRVASGTGSGIMLEPGLVLTNYHVVQASTLIGVQGDDWSSGATLIGGDPALDIALLQLDFYLGFDKGDPEFGASSDLVVGQPAYVLGYPLGIGKSISAGIISGLNRKIPLNTVSWTTRYIQTDAAVSGGNSGGALVDGCGRIVGIVTLRSTHSAAENIGYALPSDSALPLVGEILERGYVSRPWHGLYGQMMTPLIAALLMIPPENQPAGFLIETVEPGSAGDKAGLRGGQFPVLWGNADLLLGGDVITEVNGEPIGDLDTALATVEALKIGETVRLKVWRNGGILDLTAEIEERPVLERDLWPGGQRNRADRK